LVEVYVALVTAAVGRKEAPIPASGVRSAGSRGTEHLAEVEHHVFEGAETSRAGRVHAMQLLIEYDDKLLLRLR